MTNEEIRLRRPVLRRATETGCAGWTPITRTPAEPPPASGRSAENSATGESADEVEPLPTIDPSRR
jgi:hypothetical protein